MIFYHHFELLFNEFMLSLNNDNFYDIYYSFLHYSYLLLIYYFNTYLHSYSPHSLSSNPCPLTSLPHLSPAQGISQLPLFSFHSSMRSQHISYYSCLLSNSKSCRTGLPNLIPTLKLQFTNA